MKFDKLLKVQQELKTIKKSDVNPFFNSKYFDINSLIEELKPLLNKHDLIVVQPLTNLAGKPALRTTLVDGDNILVDDVIPLPENIDPQKMGSAITYFRRYALQSLFFMQAEDDDGNSSSYPTQAAKPTSPQKTSKLPVSTDESYIDPVKLRNCDMCNSPYKYIPAGTSKIGKAYNAFYACSRKDCNGKKFGADMAHQMLKDPEVPFPPDYGPSDLPFDN